MIVEILGKIKSMKDDASVWMKSVPLRLDIYLSTDFVIV